MSDSIRVLVFQEEDLWVAQCLEYDISAQAEDLDTLRLHLEATLELDFAYSMERNGEPFAGIDPAPERFHQMWERRARSFEQSRETSFRNGGAAVHLDMALAS